VDSKAKNGNSQAEIRYSFEDETPINGAVVYYRLKQIDMDGKSTFSPVRSIKLSNARNINIYPNPSQGALTIQHPNVGQARTGDDGHEWPYYCIALISLQELLSLMA